MIGRPGRHWSFALGCLLAASATAAAAETPGFRVPEGFEASLYAGDDLATNIHALTVDHRGRVVVSGPGYIKILHDDDGDGRAERAKLFSELPKSGAQGLLVDVVDDRHAILCTGDDGLLILHDDDDNETADAPPGTILALGTSERGAHGIAKGPDGDYYVACGQAAGLADVQSKLTVLSPVRTPVAGGILRVSFRKRNIVGLVTQFDVVAHGFRNPYDLDFNAAGHLFTADGDDERDYGLPWYAPARLFDVAQGREHGWVLKDRDHGWNRPAYFFDAVAPTGTLGRAAPTGLVVYRHRQFPERYRGNVLTACWATGRVYHLPLTRDGATYSAAKEIFLEPIGDAGLTPVDLAVGPDGDLFVACGGRGTPGAVFRVRYVGDDRRPAVADSSLKTEPVPLNLTHTPEQARVIARGVLRAPQPLAAWSRARWRSTAVAVGQDAFLKLIADSAENVDDQVRAVEVLADVFDGPTIDAARKAIGLKRPELSARIAWAVERRASGSGWPELSAELTHDADPRVQAAAWQAFHTFLSANPLTNPFEVSQIVNKAPKWNCVDEPQLDRRVRAQVLQAAATFTPPQLTGREIDQGSAVQWRALELLKAIPEEDRWSAKFARDDDVDARLRSLRSRQKRFGDFLGDKANSEIYAGYRVAGLLTDEAREAIESLEKQFPTGVAEVDRELARTSGMFEMPLPSLLEKLAAKWTDDGDPSDDVHYLIIASLIPGARSPQLSQRTADALLALDAKLAARGIRPEANWRLRIGEIFTASCLRDAQLARTLVDAPSFGRPAHALFVPLLPPELRRTAAQQWFAAIRRLDPDEIAWDRELIDVAASSDDAAVVDYLRSLWKHTGLREAILPTLVRADSPVDRPRFVEALTASQPEVVTRAAFWLQRRVRSDPAPHEIAAAVRGLRQMCTLPEAKKAREELLTLLELWSGRLVIVDEPSSALVARRATALRDAYQPAFLAVSLTHYPAAGAAVTPSEVRPTAWRKRLLTIDWDAGDVLRGQAIFEKKQCVRCHTGGSKLGPDLEGAAARYSRSDLLATIFEPSRFVPPAYRPTTVERRDGRSVTGIAVHDTSEVVLLQTGADAVVRIAGRDVAAKRPSTQSIMPLGLLNDLDDRGLADLYAYLSALSPR